MPEHAVAADVKIGDRIRWCGRWGEVVEISPTHKQRKGRWLTVAFQGKRRRLHYFNVEMLLTELAHIDGCEGA